MALFLFTKAILAGLIAHVDYRPVGSVEDGVARFVEWYRGYYR